MKKKIVNIRYKRLVPISIFRFAHHLHKSRFDLKVRSSAERKEKKNSHTSLFALLCSVMKYL